MLGREEEQHRLPRLQNRGEPESTPTKSLESFSLATYLFLMLISQPCRGSLIFTGQFGDQIERRTKCRERNVYGKNSDALPGQRVRPEFIEKSLRCDLRAL